MCIRRTITCYDCLYVDYTDTLRDCGSGVADCPVVLEIIYLVGEECRACTNCQGLLRPEYDSDDEWVTDYSDG